MSDSSISAGVKVVEASANSDIKTAANKKAAIACRKCGATKVAKSHSKAVDRLVMHFIAKRPYRCLHCYHRFWVREAFFVSKRRVITWLALLVIVLAAGLFKGIGGRDVEAPKPFSDFGSAPNAVPGQPPEDVGEPVFNMQTAAATRDEIGNIEERQAPPPDESLVDVRQRRVDAEFRVAGEEQLDQGPQTATPEPVSDPALILEQRHTPEQLQKRLALAKAKAEHAELLNREKQAVLQQNVQKDQTELQSLLKVDINYRIDQWRRAWQAGLVDEYLSFYSEQFIPSDQSGREQWLAQRKRRIRPSLKIDLQMSNFVVAFAENNTLGTVRFDQLYQSGSYTEKSRKQLVLLKEQQEWKIISETEIDK